MPKNLLQDMVVSKKPRKIILEEKKETPIAEKKIIKTPEKKQPIKKTEDKIKINSEYAEYDTKNTIPEKRENKIESKPELFNTLFRKTSKEDHLDPNDFQDLEFEIKDKSNKSKRALWLVALVSIVFLFFAFASLFSKATVNIQPKTESVFLNEKFSAFKDSNIENVLPFTLMSLSGEETKDLVSTGESDFAEKAKGSVIIYNNFSTASQKLAIDTRLEGTNGKIYKTEKEIVVPGMKKKNLSLGIQEDLPGSIEVGIYASVAGQEYNSPPLDFKIVGFKGTTKYEKIFARSSGEIKGGLLGKYSSISEEDRVKTADELRNALEQKLIKKMVDQLPARYILLKNATVLRTLEPDIDMSSLEKEIPMTIKGTMYGFLFEEEKITNEIAKTVIEKYDGSDVFIPNIDELNFALTIDAELTSFTNLKDIDFSLSGEPKIVWKIEEKDLKDSLLGKTKKEFNSIMSKFTNIDGATLTLRPIWRTTIPEKSKDIEIVIKD